MNNSDMPAIPCDVEIKGKQSMYHPNGMMACTGLTKREMMAMAAMQGLCAHSGDYQQPEHLAMDAVMFAGALLAELDRTKCQS